MNTIFIAVLFAIPVFWAVCTLVEAVTGKEL